MKRKYSGVVGPNKKFRAVQRVLPNELKARIFNTYRAGLQSRIARPIARAGLRRVAGLAGRALIRRGMMAAGAMVPYVGPAIGAASLAYEGYNAYNDYQKAREVARNKPFSGMSTGNYSGKFKKVSRRVGPYQKKKEVTQALGFVINKETHGKVGDADCVYLGHSTYDVDTIAYSVSYALIRKLLKLAGCHVTSPDERLPLHNYAANGGSSDGLRIVYSVEDGDGNVTKIAYDLSATSTLTTVVSQIGLSTTITQMMEGAGGTRPDVCNLENLFLYKLIGVGGSAEFVLLSQINLKNEIVTIWAKSTMTIQNRTKSADAGSGDTDQVDSVPLKGLRYKFRGGVMESKQQDNWKLNRMFRDGLTLLRSADLNPAQHFKEPPPAKQWNNCIGSSYERLEPGHIKKGTVFFKKTGYLNNVLHQMTSKMGTNGNNLSYAPGSSELYAFEEVVNTGNTNIITLQYEREFTAGCIPKKGKAPSCVAVFNEATRSNIPA